MSTAGSPRHLIVMGVSGSGKSTVAAGLQQRLGWPFAEGDDFHPPANVAKMSAGTPLRDEDRWPWLRALAGWIAEHDARGESTVMTCSALRRVYRDVLRGGSPGVYFVHLVGEQALLQERMGGREGHYMPLTLLQSQLGTLEPLAPDEAGLVCDVSRAPEEITAEVLAHLDLPARA